VSLKIEDHYWDRSDAAVVFRRDDTAPARRASSITATTAPAFPWNDTAQLDYLNPTSREAVIQTILAIARRSPSSASTRP
jgi:hypothetical protein